jgi:WD40 repeat protein
LIYAGSKDGQVKACFAKNDKLEIFSSILTHTQSVNAISTLYENPYGLVTASQDKTIKLWQPTRETL